MICRERQKKQKTKNKKNSSEILSSIIDLEFIYMNQKELL